MLREALEAEAGGGGKAHLRERLDDELVALVDARECARETLQRRVVRHVVRRVRRRGRRARRLKLEHVAEALHVPARHANNESVTDALD